MSLCPHCGRPKETQNVTCTASACQEAEFHANADRNKSPRRRWREREIAIRTATSTR